MMRPLLILALYFTVSLVTADYPFRNVNLDWQTRVDDLVSRLSLEEIGMQMAKGGGGVNGGPAPAIPRLGIPKFQWNTECLRGLARFGKATCFPQSINLGAMFDWRSLNKVAEAIGVEVRAKHNNNTAHGYYGDWSGINCWAPMLNMMRHPLWGRNQEVYGEDPYLTGRYAEAYVQGLQGTDERYLQISANCKSFVAYAGPEINRHAFDVVIAERDLRLTFLPAFKRCVGAGTSSYMCSYNSINGTPMCANKRVLNDILRREWGFKGFVVSDMGALEDIVDQHKYRNTTEDTVTASLNAGCNLELSRNVRNSFYTHIIDVVKKGMVPESLVRDMVKPLFLTRMRLGDFDPPHMNPYTRYDVSLVQSPAHQDLAVKTAMKSFVLLKNDGLLPLQKKFQKIAMVGPMTDNLAQLYGDYSTEVEPQYGKTPLQGLRRLADIVVYGPGCMDNRCTHYDSSNVTGAVTGAQLVIVSLGTGVELEHESIDRADMNLPGRQADILKDAIKYGEGAAIVLLLFSGGPLNITFADQDPRVGAILQCFFPAQGTGDALYNTLTMATPDASPAGRLPYTWYKTTDQLNSGGWSASTPFATPDGPFSHNAGHIKQIPPMMNYTMNQRTYRYFTGVPAYPFGYGLSYTTFSYSNLQYDPQVHRGQRWVMVKVDVTNTGNVASDEVAQVYISWASTKEEMPRLQLVGFDRMFIVAKETVIFEFKVLTEDLAVWTDNSGFIVEEGIIHLYVGGQQPDQKRQAPSNILERKINITETFKLER